jgi:hypothetical protein
MIEKNVEQINTGATEAVAERQELHSEVVNVDSVKSLDDQCLDQHINVRRRRKLKERTQENGVSRKELIAAHTRAICHAVPAVRKVNMLKRAGSESTARRMPHLEFNMGRDHRVERERVATADTREDISPNYQKANSDEGNATSWFFHWTTRCRRLDVLEGSANAQAIEGAEDSRRSRIIGTLLHSETLIA